MIFITLRYNNTKCNNTAGEESFGTGVHLFLHNLLHYPLTPHTTCILCINSEPIL